MRAAIYFAPPADAEATRLAAAWLGRDAFTNAATRGPDPAIDPLVADPVRYGFHATMKAPFALREDHSLADLDARLGAFCAGRPGATIERLVLRSLGGFLALVPDRQSTELTELAAEVVRDFEPFRAPLTPAEIARRRPDDLSERQRDHLEAWGYPYVFDEFRFHMTLTGKLAEPEAARAQGRLAERFAAVTDRPLAVDGLALFVEPEPGAPFVVRARHAFAAA